MHAFTGTILRVDLGRREITKEPLNQVWARDFIGASGLAARYLYDMIDGTTDPLGPDNPLVWMVGMLTGTRTPSSSRSAFCSRSPLTGIWGESNVGGFAGSALRAAGYDGIIITGQAETPVFLLVDGAKAELRDARVFWGLDTFETQKQISKAIGDKRVHVIGIGPAGENLVRYAAIITGDARAAGRTGMGAVMGSKRLKAIAIRGRSSPPSMADGSRFRQAARRSLTHVQQDFFIQLLKEMGTSNGVEFLNMLGDVPSRYWTGSSFEDIENLNGAVMAETIRVGSSGCWGCCVQCGPEIEIPDGPHKMDRGPGPEYETLISLGSQLLVGDLCAVSHFGHLCDVLGMDTISAGAAIGFAYYLYDQGIINAQDTGGLELRWGDEELISHLIGLISRREGFGDALAEGVRALERRFNAQGLAVQVNGLDLAMHDPRGIAPMALIYLTSPRGACHNKSDFYMIAAGHSYPEIGVELSNPQAVDGVAPEVVRHQDWRTFIDSSGCCLFVNAPMDDMVEMVSAATGQQENIETLSLAGERILTLKRLINLKLGFRRSDEVLPKLVMEPLYDSNSGGFVPDAQRMLAEYYRERDWDLGTGRPSDIKLERLGLGDLH